MRGKHGIQERDPTEKNTKGKLKGESWEAGHGRNHLERGLKREVCRRQKIGAVDDLLIWGKGALWQPAQQPFLICLCS